MPPEAGGRDAALILDMAFAARDAMALPRAWTRPPSSPAGCIRTRSSKAAGRVSPGFRSQHPEIPWRDITGMRHRLIHGYAEVRRDVVWAVVKDRLPALLATLERLLPPEASQ